MHRVNGKRDIVLFLGAGFSADAGLPVMSSFGNASQVEYETLVRRHFKPPGEQEHRHAAGLLENAGRVFRAFQVYCDSASKNIEVDTENIETVFCLAEALRETGQDHIGLRNATYSTTYLHEQIQLWLWKIYQRCLFLDRTTGFQRGAYDQFVRLLKQGDLPSRVAVLTTNYDLVFEYVSWDAGMVCTYPFATRDGVERLKAGDREDTYVNIDLTGDGPLVCKLHGSSNFFATDNSQTSSTLGVVCDLSHKDDRIGHSWTPEAEGAHCPNKRPAIFMFDAIWALRAKYGPGLVPAIIPPTYAKLQAKPWLRQTWRSALHAIREATTIVFIGYSLPDSDGFMRAMFQGAFAEREGPAPKIYVFDPSDEVRTRYANLFANVELQNYRFAEACEGPLQKVFESL